VPNQPIVPFVEDHRNVLILRPDKPLELEAMATLQAALKRGIEMVFQIEESELVAEPLPKQDERKACCSTKRPRAARACSPGWPPSPTPWPRWLARRWN
jgi:hypothetical protein